MRLKTPSEHHATILRIGFLVAVFVGCFLILDPSLAVTVEALKEPISNLKSEIFGAWMVAVKIAAMAVGIVLSAFKGSLAPFGIGAGLSMGIHLYDLYLGEDIAAGALI